MNTSSRTPRALCILGASALALGLQSGCDIFLGKNRGNDRVSPEGPNWLNRPGGAFQVAFRRDLTNKAKVSGEEYEHGSPEIDVESKRVFVGSSDSGLYALNAGDGSTIWRFETLGPVQSEPLYDRELDYVYFGSHDGGLYCVRAFDGSLVYRYDAGGDIRRRAVRVGETLVFATASDTVFAISRRTGKKIWTQKRASAAAMEMANYSGPTIDNGAVYVGFSDGHVGAFRVQDGAEVFASVDLLGDSTAGQDARYLDVDTTPIADTVQGTRAIYVAAHASGVFALDARTGARLWSNEKVTGVGELALWVEPEHRVAPGEPAVPAKKLLFAASGQALTALEPENQGRIAWTLPMPDGGVSAPKVIAGAIVVGTPRHGLFLISARDGKVIDGIDPGTGISQTPAVWANKVYALSNGGSLMGLEVLSPRTTMEPRNSYPALGIAPVP
jgi:outer membrane protein assembly factor BamB